MATASAPRQRLLMDPQWRFRLGDPPAGVPDNDHGATYSSVKAGAAGGYAAVEYDDSAWREVDLPHDFAVEGVFDPANNLDHGFLPTGVGWYRKTFYLPEEDLGRRLALVAFAWAMAIAGLFMVEEALSGAWVYQQLRELTGDPTRPDLAAKNVAQGAFALALLTPSAAVGGWRAGAPWALGLVMVAGVVAAGVAFDTDAPLLALVVAVAAGGLAMRWPTAGPVTLAVLAVVFWLSGPTLVLLAKAGGLWDPIQAAAPLSWSQRMDYWSNAVRLIAEHPIRGWGMEASRTFAPAIKLHPHDASLQVWLELGAVGALCVAAFWTAILMRLRRDRPDAAVAAGVASAAVYLLFAAVSFGVWQEWLVALGALAAVFAFAAELTPRRIDRRE